MTVVPVLFVLIAIFNRQIAVVAGEVRERESQVYSLVQWAMSLDQGGAGLHQGRRGAQPLHGREPRQPRRDAAAL